MSDQVLRRIAQVTLPRSLRDRLRPFWHRINDKEIRNRAREVAKVNPANRWASQQGEELDFWTQVLDANNFDPALYPETRFLRTLPDLRLQHYLTDRINAVPGAPVRILDVGAGPLTCLGKKWPGHQVDIVAVDPNAAEYDRILRQVGIEPLCRTIFGFAEQLLDVVESSSFDLAHARNCLDHAKDPLAAIRQMILAVKPGCRVFLNHKSREGQNQAYAGPHQWNLFERRTRFFMGRPGMRSIDVGRQLRDIATLVAGPSPDGPAWFSVTITRHI